MFDLEISKLALIGAVALVVIGPEKMPRVARTIGTLLGKAQRYVSDVKAEVNRSMDMEDLKKMKETMDSAMTDVQKKCAQRHHQAQRRRGQFGHGWAGGKRLPADHSLPMDAAAAQLPTPRQELARQALGHAAVVQIATRCAHPRLIGCSQGGTISPALWHGQPLDLYG